MTDHAKTLYARYKDSQRQVEKQFREEYPEATSIAAAVKIAVYTKRPKGFGDHATRVVRMFLSSKATLRLSNAKLAQKLSEDFPGYDAPANLLTEKLTAIDKRKIKAALVEFGVNLDIRQLTTPSKIKKALVSMETSSSSIVEFHGKVTFSNDAIVVGTKTYPIQRSGKLFRIAVGKHKLNVEGLRKLLTS